MTTFSKLTSVTLTNFMSFPEAYIEFDSPTDLSGFRSDAIINLKGYNDSGKSAILIGAGVCLMNAYPRDQKKFIREGTTFFRVDCSFDDGITIRREKHSNGNSLYEMFDSDGNILYTTRAGDILTNTEGIPAEIENYLGLFSSTVSSTTYLLNMRRRTDPRLLVGTSKSDNFALLNEVLKTEELARAAKAASAKANETQQDLNSVNVNIVATQQNLDALQTTPEFVDALSHFVDSEDALQNSHDSVEQVHTLFSNLPEVLSNNLDDLTERFLEAQHTLGTLREHSTTIRELLETSVLPSLEEALPFPYESQASVDLLLNLKALLDDTEGTQIISPVTPLFDSLNLSQSAVSSLQTLQSHLKEFQTIEADCEHSHQQISTLSASLSQAGYSVVDCPSCGSSFPTNLSAN